MSNPGNGARPRKWAVVINESAGAPLARETLESTLHELLLGHGLEAEVHLVPGPEIEETIREALDNGAEGIAAGGGDGTISTAAGVLAHGTVPLGVLPLGTLNHFAKDLGIPLDLAGAVRVLAEGHLSRIDLGEVNGHPFINNSSIGGYPDVIRLREHHRRHFGRAKWTAHAIAFFRFLRRFRVLKVLLHLNDAGVIRKTPFVFVGNNEYLLDETLTATRRSLTGSCLCVYTARCDNGLQFLRLFGLLLANRLADAPEFHAHCVEEVRVQTRHAHLHVSRDGEIFKMDMPLHYRILSQALPVFLPPPTPEA